VIPTTNINEVWDENEEDNFNEDNIEKERKAREDTIIRFIHCADTITNAGDNQHLIKEINRRYTETIDSLYDEDGDGSFYLDLKDRSLRISTKPNVKLGGSGNEAILNSFNELLGMQLPNFADKFNEAFSTEAAAPPNAQFSSALSRFTPESARAKSSVYAQKQNALNLFEARCDRGYTENIGYAVTRVHFAGDYAILSTVESDPLLYIYNLGSKTERIRVGSGFGIGRELVLGVNVDLPNNMVWAGDKDHIVGVKIEGEDKKIIYTTKTGGYSVLSLGNRVLAGGKNGRVNYWDIASLEQGKTTDSVTGSFNLDMLYAPEEKKSSLVNYLVHRQGHPEQVVYGARESYHFSQFNLHTQKLERVFQGHGAYIQGLYTNATLPEFVGSAGCDRTARLWDSRASQACVFTLAGHSERVESLDFTLVDGVPFAFTGSNDEGMKVWDLRLALPLYELSSGNSEVRGLFYHNNSNTLFATIENRYNNVNADDVDDEGWPASAVHKVDDFDEMYTEAYCNLITYNFKSAPEQPSKHRKKTPKRNPQKRKPKQPKQQHRAPQQPGCPQQ
jgi:hypothetical protein